MTAVQQTISKQTKWVFVEEGKLGDAGQAKEGLTRSRELRRCESASVGVGVDGAREVLEVTSRSQLRKSL